MLPRAGKTLNWEAPDLSKSPELSEYMYVPKKESTEKRIQKSERTYWLLLTP